MPVTPVCVPSPNVGQHGYITIVDGQGYVIGTVATSDGAQFGTISGESQFLYTSGGPPLLDGTPSQLAFDRVRGYLGKATAQGTISSSVVGDTNLAFSAAPKSIMPGMPIRIQGGAVSEYVFVAQSPTFTPSAVTTTIPLQSPVVNAGQTLALWEVFDPTGPNGGPFSPMGVGLTALAMQSTFTTQLTAAVAAAVDAEQASNILQIVAGKMISATLADRERMPNVYKPFNAQALTATGSNTPVAIWTPTSGKKFRLMGYWFSTTVAAGLVFHDLATVGNGGVMAIPSPVYAAAGVMQSPPIGNGVISVATNNKLWIDATSVTTITGFCWGTEE